MTEQSYSQHAYIRRRGRITAAQQRGLELADSRYHFDLEKWQPGGDAGLEIGFGMGQALLHWARQQPDRQLIGVELYQPGIGSLAHLLDQENIDNVRIAQQPAQELLGRLPDRVMSEVRIYFPDPWPKKRHFKRRLIQAEFLDSLLRVMQPQGVVKLATDWAPYAEWMRECFAGHTGFSKTLDLVRTDGESETGDDRPTTKFERRGEGLGHDIHDLIYQVV